MIKFEEKKIGKKFFLKFLSQIFEGGCKKLSVQPKPKKLQKKFFFQIFFSSNFIMTTSNDPKTEKKLKNPKFLLI